MAAVTTAQQAVAGGDEKAPPPTTTVSMPPAGTGTAHAVAAAVSAGGVPLLGASEQRRRAEDSQTSDRKGSCRQWLVLFIYCLNTALNSFISVNFSVVEMLSRHTLDVGRAEIAWLYSGFLLAVAVGMFPTVLLMTDYEGQMLGFSVLANVSCTWVRWLGVRSRSYGVCFLSAVLNAAGAWVLLPLPAQLSQQRFPPELCTLTTSLAIQANYSGWLLGSLLPTIFIQDEPHSMERFMFVQACCAVPVVLGFFLFYRVPPPQAPMPMHTIEAPGHEIDMQSSPTAGGGHHGGHAGHSGGSLKEFLQALGRYPSLGMQILAYGVLGGISFSFAALDDTLLEPHGFSPQTVATANVSYLATGVVCGILLGAKCKPRNFPIVLKTLFIICSLALTALAVLLAVGGLPGARPRPPGPPAKSDVLAPAAVDHRHLALVMALFALVGGPALGFIGLGIEAAALYPAGGAYVCFAIEGLVQILGAVFNLIAHGENGFIILAAFAWFATCLLLFGYRDYVPSADALSSSGRRSASEAEAVCSERGSVRELESGGNVCQAPKLLLPDPAG